ncbi:MAG: cytochrome c3 family protein [Thermodesulfobacteriota bacterium]
MQFRGSKLLYVFFVVVMGHGAEQALAGDYTESAHGDSVDGVNRSSMVGYSVGNCAHCHEQHASVDGAEAEPVGGEPAPYTLFDGYTSQTENFCLRCHTEVGSCQSGGIINRSYSYRAGNYSADSLNDIEEAFSFTVAGSSHSLDDILTFVDGKWGYNAYSNPCVACHNPHAVKGDPFNSPCSAKDAGNRGYPVSRPSQHADLATWGLWGDGNGEKMSDVSSNYQAPYRNGSTMVYEPDGSTTQDGSNLTDFVTFCTDCHDKTNTIYSARLGRNLYKINWSGVDYGGTAADLHGAKKGRDAYSDKGTIKAPYDEGSATDYTLSCTDCHEPHGSPNAFLLRKEVNGVVISVDIHATNDNGGWTEFCLACHDVTVTGNGGPCGTNFHGAPSWPLTKPCHTCHKHGAYVCTGGNSSF